MKSHFNYFSSSEQTFIKKFQDWRTRLLQPISHILASLGITPSMISALGLLVLAGFVFYIPSQPLYSLCFLILHVVLDALDGSLARYMKRDTDAGAIVDMVCDHTGMIIVTGTLMYQGLIQQNFGAVYILLYTFMVILIIVLNRLNLPLRFVIRTKYFLYILFALWAIWGVNYFNIAIIIFILLMIAPTVFGLLKLSRYWR